jgi:hypothetical protein
MTTPNGEWPPPEPEAGGAAVLFWSCQFLVASGGTTNYINYGFFQGQPPQVNYTEMPMPRDGTLRNLTVRHNRAAGNGNGVDYELWVDGIATGVAVLGLPTGAVVQGDSGSASYPVLKGQRVGLRSIHAMAIGNGQIWPHITCEFS